VHLLTQPAGCDFDRLADRGNMLASMDDCVFCGILAGSLPASVVMRDAGCTAFMDIQPVNVGHVLVVPDGHAASLADLPDDAGAQLFWTAQKVVAALYASGLGGEGINLFLADGEAAGQEVFHVHLHVIPRFKGDGFGLTFSPDYADGPTREDLERTAKRIGGAL
jgi:histidine triad (HIT) family protein